MAVVVGQAVRKAAMASSPRGRERVPIRMWYGWEEEEEKARRRAVS